MTVDDVMTRLDVQQALFAPQPLRAALRRAQGTLIGKPLTVRVHRNVAAEHLFTSVASFASYAGYDITAEYMAYDDTLSLAAVDDGQPDLEFVWLDIGRLDVGDPEALADVIASRVSALRARSSAPVLVANSGALDEAGAAFDQALSAALVSLPAVEIADLSAVHRDMGDGFASDRRTDLTAVPLSAAALVRVAQRMGLQWIPAMLRPAIKAVVVDLDNTLYAGVLGEDGATQVDLTTAHAALQQVLHDLHERGVFVVVVSRNERDDVVTLFESRDDFPLKAVDVDVWEVSWDAKSAAVNRAAAALRISTDAMLVVDDNPGELAEIARGSACREFVLAVDPGASLRGLTLAPGMFRFGAGQADRLRVHDLRSERERAALRDDVDDPQEYLRSLGVTLSFGIDLVDDLSRAAELSRKTNQFTTALARLDETQLAERMSRPDATVVTVALRDRFSDSGVIAMICARRVGERIAVDDVCVSCRALGRGMESAIVLRALAAVGERLDATSFAFAVNEGARNAPAREWISQVVGPGNTIDHLVVEPSDPVTVEWRP